MTESRSAALRTATVGAAFLMATSAIGPGFLTQTAVFTAQLGASFGFAILISILFDLGAQINIWRVVAVAERRAQDVANDVWPGLGHVIAALVTLGGLAFNIGNIAGTGLGLDALAGIDVRVGATASAIVAIAIFLVREAGRAMDRFAQALGLLMIVLVMYVVIVARPPAGEAALRTVVPLEIDPLSIVTIVGGTVGGYITFAGAHRLLDAGIHGRHAVGRVTRTAAAGIGVASLMRILLFLATLGVVAHGATLDPSNPPASTFRHAAGEIGQRLFGIVMWAASITSVVGAAYTSVSFLRSVSPTVDRAPSRAIIVFIAISTAMFLVIGRPVTVLVLVGALNGLILPVSLGAMLVAAHRRRVVGDYRHPPWLTGAGAVVAVAMAALGVRALLTIPY
ncbi:MAG: NRAMP family divalent metal transporter [Gemmatimonadaceae bacterium]